MNYYVTVMYDPGTPKRWFVFNATDQRDAQTAVLARLGYHPGVSIKVQEAKQYEEHNVVGRIVNAKTTRRIK